MEPIKVLIADDHAMVREGLSTALQTTSTIRVVGMAANGREAIEKVKTLKPNVVLMDIKMPNMDGLKACRLIKKSSPEIQVIMLTVHDDETHVIDAITAGASGYILKSLSVNELIRALTDNGSGGFNLSDRELQVLQLLAYGHTNKEIATELTISQQTVKSHVIHIFQKLGACDRTEAVAIALRRGIVE